jgi:DNA-directed RNA polymerase II subunit RPB2
MEKNGKLIQPCKLKNSQLGMICPFKTPEGAAVGLVKNIALSPSLTVNTSSVFVFEVIVQYGTQLYNVSIENPGDFLRAMGSDEAVHIMVNCYLVGFHIHLGTLYAMLKTSQTL